MQVVEFWFELSAANVAQPAVLSRADLVNAFGCDDAQHLGSGAFGETWRIATGSSIEAVKVILEPSYPMARLEQEAEGLRRCTSPHVVQLHEISRRLIGGEDRAYFRAGRIAATEQRFT